MKHIIRRGNAVILFLSLLLSIAPLTHAEEETLCAVENATIKHSGEKILGYWINPSNFSITNANIDNLTNLGVTDLYVLVKGEAGSINTSSLKNVISYASSKVRVHAWLMCSRDNTYLKNNPKHAVYHFRVGYKNNAHSSSSSYYDSRNGYVDLRNTSYQKYFNGIVDDLEAIDGLDGIHLDTIRYGGDYYDWSTNLKNALGKANYNTVAKAMCKHHGYTYSTDSDGYYVYKGTTTGDDSSLKDLVNANDSIAQAYIDYRTATVTNFVKSVRSNLASNMILTAACMPEPAMHLYGKSTYGQDFAGLAPYVDYVQIMSYFGDYYHIIGDVYDTAWPANISKTIAKMGCNVVAGIQGYAFVNEDTSGRNDLNPTGYESQKQAEAINDARREVNGDPTYGGDILGSAVFRAGTCAQANVSYNPSSRTVTFKLVAGDTAIKSIRIRMYNNTYIDKSKCSVSDTSYTYNGVTYAVTGTPTDGYYHTFDLNTTISAYGTKTLTIPVCKSDGTAKTPDYNNNNFAAVNIYSSTSKNTSTYLPIYIDGYVNSEHKTCTFVKTTPQPATCVDMGYHLYTCTTCNYDYSESIPQLSHEYVSTVTPPTCTEDGFTTVACKNGCNDSYTQDPVTALGHNYEVTRNEPTCTQNGAIIHTCLRCNDSYEEIIEALGHDYTSVLTPPDCIHDGFTTYTCACGESYTDEITPALGHSYQYASNGDVHLVTCENCDLQFEEPHVPSGNLCINCNAILCEHSNERSVVDIEATCLSVGSERVFCADCDEYLRTQEIPAKGHDLSYYAYKMTTCTESGNREHWQCNSCKAYFIDENCEFDISESYAIKPALGHSYLYTPINSNEHEITCARCTYRESAEHSYANNLCVCGAKKEPIIDKSLTFTMNISAGAEMVVSYSFMASNVKDKVDFYLEVTKSVADGESFTTRYGFSEGRIPFTVTSHPITGEDLFYGASFEGISAKEMGDTFSATLYAVSADGNVYRSNTTVSSIKDFLLGKLNADSPQTRTMAVDMLKYGAAAQVRFGYDTEHLVTDDLSTEQLAYATQTLPEAIDRSLISGDGANITANITIGARVELGLTVFYPSTSDAIRCVITDENGNILAQPTVSNASNLLFSATYSDVGAKQMRRVITATFFDGENAISKTLSWSVESYVAQIRAKDGVSPEELNMVNAMLIYGDAVAAYMASIGQ